MISDQPMAQKEHSRRTDGIYSIPKIKRPKTEVHNYSQSYSLSQENGAIKAAEHTQRRQVQAGALARMGGSRFALRQCHGRRSLQVM